MVKIGIGIEPHASAIGRFMIGTDPDHLGLDGRGIDDLLDVVLPCRSVKGVFVRLDLREQDRNRHARDRFQRVRVAKAIFVLLDLLNPVNDVEPKGRADDAIRETVGNRWLVGDQGPDLRIGEQV